MQLQSYRIKILLLKKHIKDVLLQRSVNELEIIMN